ncbi:MAG: adenosine deaminase [Thermoguttaceae bacterium]
MKNLSSLHLHFEGSVRLETLTAIARRKNMTPPNPDIYSFGNFEQFNEVFRRIFSYITEEEDFYETASAFASDLHKDGVTYCETFLIPLAHILRGVPVEKFLPPILSAFDEAKRNLGVRINLIFSIIRNGGNVEWGERTLDLILSHTKNNGDSRIVGIDICGTECFDTIEPFRDVFKKAKSHGLLCTAHAGEFCGAEHVRKTIEILEPHRIGHGIGAVNDTTLVGELIRRDIPLEICPSSNLRLGAVGDIKNHPIRKLFESGVPIVVGADDPAIFNCTLSNEYELLINELGFNDAEIQQLKNNAIRYAVLAE